MEPGAPPATAPSPSRRPGVYLAIAFLALPIILAALWFQKSTPALPAPLETSDLSYPVHVDGRTIGTAEEMDFAVWSRRPGDRMIVETREGTKAFALEQDLTVPTLVLTWIGSLLFWVVAAFVFAPRVGHPGARPFFWLLLLGGLSLSVWNGNPPVFGEVQKVADIFCLGFIPPCFLHLTLRFPRAAASPGRTARIAALLYAIAFASAATRAVVWLRFAHDPTTPRWDAAALAEKVGIALLVLEATAGFVILWRGGRRAVLDQERRQAWWLLWGIGIGAIPFVFLRELPIVLRVASPVDLWVDRVFELAIPLAFATAVVRYRFFDIDVIVRRSAIYTILAFLLLTAYLLAVLWFGPQTPTWPEALRILAVAVAVALFLPMRRFVGGWVDRAFFHMRRDYAKAGGALSDAIAAATSQREVADLLSWMVPQTVGAGTSVVVVRARDVAASAGSAAPQAASAATPLLDHFGPERSGPVATVHATGRPEIETDRFPRDLEQAGIVLVQPAVAEGKCFAVLGLGGKASGRRYVEEDLSYLARAASVTGEALARMDLVQRMAEEETARRSLAELDRLKTEFLFRVAHDLRTPLTSIDWSTRNLLDGVAGPVTAKQSDYLQSVQAACRGLTRRVSDIVEISRLELGAARVSLGPVDLASVVEECAAGLRPVAAAKGVRIEVRVLGTPPPVRADRDKCFAVVQNLLDNALKYSPPDSAAEAAISTEEDGRVRLTVRDRGPGLDEAEKATLFDRYRQGRASPYSDQKGFGLGLHIVKSYVGLFGGRVSADNHPDGGARFAVVLDAWTPEGAGDGEGAAG